MPSSLSERITTDSVGMISAKMRLREPGTWERQVLGRGRLECLLLSGVIERVYESGAHVDFHKS